MTEGVSVERADWDRDAQAILAVRRDVFTHEQGVPEELETDAADADSLHFVARDHRGEMVGVGRLLPDGQIGRMAVLAQRRGFGIGRLILDAALEAAQARGDAEVFLNAQTHAIGFYERAGFISIGDVFDEAGIPHQRMEKQLGIRFTPPPDVPREVLKSEETRLPYSGPELASHENAVLNFDEDFSITDRLTELTALGRREVLIFSPDLDHELFDHAELADALSLCVRRNVQARARILVHDIKRVVQEGHALLNLARRLPSHIEIRLVHPDMRDREDCFLVADRTGLLVLPKAHVRQGFVNFCDQPLARQYAEVIDRLWDRSITDPNLRQFSL